MHIASYAKGSSYGERVWLNADAALSDAGFDADDRKAILHCAKKNGGDPQVYAQAAVRLRRHVEAGLPLSPWKEAPA